MTDATLPAGATGYTPVYRLLVVVTSLMATLAMSLSATVVNVAVPDIMGAFGVGQDQAQWMATAYFAAMTTGMLVSDWSTRTFGQRDTFIVTTVIFILGSVMGGTAENFTAIAVARAIQGFAGGIMLTLTMISMFMVFPPNRRATVAGLYGISFVLGPGLGPWFGGMAIDAFDWRFTFYVAVPPAFLAAIMAAFILPGRQATGARTRLDWVGFVLVATFLAATLIGLSNGQLKGWSSDFVVFSILGGLAAAAAFVIWESRAHDPIFDVRLLRYPRFAIANVVSFLFGASLFGALYLAPIFVQIVQNYTPTRAGEVLIPGALGLGLALPIVGRLADRYPPYLLLFTGFGLFGLSMWALGIADPNTAFWTFALLIFVGRVGHGMIFPPLTVAGLGVIPPERIGNANGILSFTRQMGGAFGINALGIFLEQRTAFYSQLLAASQTEANTMTSRLLAGVRELLAAAGMPEATERALAFLYLNRMVGAQATALAYRDTFVAFALVSLLSALVALMLWTPLRRRY